MNSINLASFDRFYQEYKQSVDKNNYIATHWLHEDFTISAKTWIGKWLDSCIITRFFYRKFFHINLNATFEKLTSINTESLTDKQRKQIKQACKLLACFGSTKLGWENDDKKICLLNDLYMQVCAKTKTSETPENPPHQPVYPQFVEDLLTNDLWTPAAEKEQDLKFWLKRPTKKVEFVDQLNISKFEEERKAWITDAQDHNLYWCGCRTEQERRIYETELISTLVTKFPPDKHAEINVMSVGAGDLRQDWILLNELAKKNYKKVNLLLVDPSTSEGLIAELKKLVKKLPQMEINIEAASDLQKVDKDRKFDCIYAIDFKLYDSYWEILGDTKNHLSDRGFVYATGNARFFRHQETDRWEVSKENRLVVDPRLVQANCVKIAIENVENFYTVTFPFLLELMSANVKTIQLDISSSVHCFIPRFKKLLKNLVDTTNPKVTKVAINFVKKFEANTYDIALIEQRRVARNHLVDLLRLMKMDAQLILLGSPYFLRKTDLVA